MFDEGLMEETETLLASNALTGTAAQAIGYAEAAACLRGDLTKDQAIEKTATRTRQYAKRQRTWFRNQMNSQWVRAGNKAADEIRAVWEKEGPFSFRH
jgi:tRNA dimethylallyltransferase